MSGYVEPIGGVKAEPSGTRFGSKPIRAAMLLLSGNQMDTLPSYGVNYIPEIDTPFHIRSSRLHLDNTAGTFASIVESAPLLTENQRLRIPILENAESGAKVDDIAFLKQTQAFQKKTIRLDGVDPNIIHDTTATTDHIAGFDSVGTLTKIAQIPSKTIQHAQTAYRDEANSFSALQTVRDNLFRIFNPALNAPYMFRTSAITATRNVTLPLLTADDTWVFQNHLQALTQKTIDTIQNTLKNAGNAAYEVFTDGTNWYARNTKTGVITSTNTSLTTVLQAAINGLTSGRTSKETVRVKGDGSIAKITLPSYTILDLSDAKLTLIALTEDHMIVNSDTTGGNTQIVVIGGYLDGNNDGGQGTLGTGDEDLKNIVHLQNCTDSYVLYTLITDTVCRGVRLRDSSNCIVAYNIINDTGAEGIQTRGGHSNKILFNDLRNTRYSWITTYQTPNTIIHGNYCDTVVHDSTSGFNISSLRTIVSENRLYNNGNSTISLSESTSTYECSGSRIINNYIHGSRFGGGIIGVGYRFHDLVISGNEVFDCALAGIRISGQHQGVIISNNIVHDNQYSGINVGGSASVSDPREILITGNLCYNNGKGLTANDVERSGITIFGTDAAGVFDVIITNNICYDTQGVKTQKYGIRAVNSDQCIITTNMVRGNLTDGMILTTNTNLVHYSNKGYSLENTVVTLSETQTLLNKTYSGGTLSGTFTLPSGTTPITFSKPQGGAEVFWDLTVDDASGSRLRLQNDTGGAGIFVPTMQFRQIGTNAGLFAGKLQGEILDTSDTGSTAVYRIDGRIGSPAAALLVNRPMLDIANFGGQRFVFYNNRLVLGIEGGTPQAVNIEIGNTTTGTRIGTATTQKIAFWNANPVTQRAFIAAPTGGATTDAEARTAINSIRQVLIDLGIMAAA